jgi:hypothetical protein
MCEKDLHLGIKRAGAGVRLMGAYIYSLDICNRNQVSQARLSNQSSEIDVVTLVSITSVPVIITWELHGLLHAFCHGWHGMDWPKSQAVSAPYRFFPAAR